MIRIILAIILLPWSCLASSGGMYPVPMVYVSGGADYCTDKLGSYSIYYDADHPSGTTVACISGGTTNVTFMTGITADAAWNITAGGTYGIMYNGAINTYLSVPPTGMSINSGRVEYKFKTPATMPIDDIAEWEWFYDASNQVKMYLNISGATWQLVATHIGGGTSTQVLTAFVSLVPDTTYYAVVDWSTVTGVLYADLNGATNTATTVTTGTTPTNPVRFGEDQAGKNPSTNWGFDDIKMGASQQ